VLGLSPKHTPKLKQSSDENKTTNDGLHELVPFKLSLVTIQKEQNIKLNFTNYLFTFTKSYNYFLSSTSLSL